MVQVLYKNSDFSKAQAPRKLDLGSGVEWLVMGLESVVARLVSEVGRSCTCSASDRACLALKMNHVSPLIALHPVPTDFSVDLGPQSTLQKTTNRR